MERERDGCRKRRCEGQRLLHLHAGWRARGGRTCVRRCGQAAVLEDANRRLAEVERVGTAPGDSDAKVWGLVGWWRAGRLR